MTGWLIGKACDRLPDDARAERNREWTAELAAVLADRSIRPSLRRTLRALAFCIGLSSAARKMSRPALAGSRGRARARWRTGVMRGQPDGDTMLLRAAVGFLAWLVIVFGTVALLRARPDPRGWPVILAVALAIGFDAFCLADIARADRVRYLPKWAWALICLIQTPGGGILYLSLGHVGRRRLPPEAASSR
jgi:hypothetical protein